MINNIAYREALERIIPNILIKDGRVLVTGASGLIGSCIIDLLLISNEHGRKFDVFALGRNKDKLSAKFELFKNSGCLHFIEQDICCPLDDGVVYDYIIHGASNADPRNYALYPAETMLINIEGTKNVLDYCKVHPCTRVLMMSSFEVYGKSNKDVYEESFSGIINVNDIRSCYPESKRCMELLTRCYVDEFGVDAVICRLCSIYGPTMNNDDSKAHAQFIKNALNGEDIILKSKGEQRRTYCYVMDAITGLLCVLDKGVAGEVYNVSNEKSVLSIAEFAQIVADYTGKKVIMQDANDIERKGYSVPQNCILDNNKLSSLGWKGRYSIHKGIKECLTILRYNKK